MAQAMYIEECDGCETEEEVFSDDDAEGDPTTAEKHRAKCRSYDLPIVSFASVELAEKAKRKKLFGGHWKQLSAKNDVLWFQCKCCGEKCKIQLLGGDRCVGSLEAGFLEMEHGDKLDGRRRIACGLTDEVKAALLNYEELNVKPQAMMENLRKTGVIVSMTQITGFLKRTRRNNSNNKFTMRGLVNWAEDRKTLPDDDDQLYVPKNEYTTEPERNFRMFMTTKRLIGFTQYVSSLYN
jgi:hypothetical protein